MKRKSIVLLFVILVVFVVLSGCNSKKENQSNEIPIETETEVSTVTISEPEILEAMELFSVPEDWLVDLEAEVTCAEMASLLGEMLEKRIESPSSVTLSWLNNVANTEEDVCSRGQAGMYIYRLVLENYHGIENAEELYLYGNYQYTMSLSIYENRVQGGCPNRELLLFNNGELPESKQASFDVWSSAYVTSQIDLINGKTIFDVTEDSYMRCEETITRKEAIIACKRTYNAYVCKTPVTMSSIGELEFTEEQIEKANQMPDASWDNLPSWNGLAFEVRESSGYIFEKDFELRQEYGFNFSRIFIDESVFDWNGEEMTVPQYILDNLDAAMNWAIEYGVHLCILVDEEGFNGASGNTQGFYSDELTERLIQCYTMLAKRYGALPNSVFSLNIFNEPWNLSLEDEDIYVAKAREVIAAIREFGDDRLIFVDGLAGSHEPVYSLANDRVAQSKHMYGPDSLTTAGGEGNWWYIAQQWPYDYVKGYLSYAGEGYNITGDFPANTEVKLQLNGIENAVGEFNLYADGVLIDSIVVDNNNQDTARTFLPLHSDSKELRIEWTGFCGINVRGIAIVYPQESEKTVPMHINGWVSKNDPDTVCKYKVVQIACENEDLGTEYNNPLIKVAEDGTYTVTHDDNKRYTYGKDYYAAVLEKWVKFSEETGVAVMVQEWGPYSDAYISQEAAIGVTVSSAEAMQEAGFPWCSWVRMLDTQKQDIEPYIDGTYRINIEMIEALAPYMDKE